jgi:hypothetical protein
MNKSATIAAGLAFVALAIPALVLAHLRQGILWRRHLASRRCADDPPRARLYLANLVQPPIGQTMSLPGKMPTRLQRLRIGHRSVRHCAWLAAVVCWVSITPIVAWASSDEIEDGPVEAVGATGQVFSAPGVTGDWGGRRTWLADRGLQISVDLTNTMH